VHREFRPLSADAAAPPPRAATLVVDGRAVPAVAGEPLVQALRGAGVDLPAVCWQPSLGPVQTCDTCAVEVDGALVRACAVEVTDGMGVRVDAPAAAAAREEAAQRLLGEHVLYCTICDHNSGSCTLKAGVQAAGVTSQRVDFRPHPDGQDRSNPFYRYDPDQCILCGRCVEACQTVQVTETLSIDWESERPRVLWDGGRPIGESSCVSCGHCVTVCPCNALIETSMLGRAGLLTSLPDAVRAPAIDLVKAVEPTTGLLPLFAVSALEATARQADTRVTKTVCTYCGVGCSFDVWTRGREVLKVQPQDEGPANAISTCVKGKFGWDHVNAGDRLTTPLIREGGRFREATWDEALDLVAHRLSGIIAAHGPDACAVIGSSKATNEEAYLTQKLARQVIGTHNVDNCSRYCQAPATTGLWRTVGYGGDSGSISDIERAGLVLVVGSNTADSHPVIAARIRRAQKLNGQQLVVADLRRHDLAARADVFLRPAPGTDLVWLSAVARWILDSGLEDRAFLDAHVDGLEAYRASLEPFTLAHAEEVTGIPADVLERTARMVAEADGVCALWAMGVTQHTMGSDTSTAISNLLLVTGNYMRPGTGAYPLRGHNNVQGASDMGSVNRFYPGYQPVEDPDVAARFAAAWDRHDLPLRPGLDNHEMIAAVHAGDLRAMYLVGEEIALVDAHAGYVQEALAKLDLFVVQELFFSATCEFADVVLPAAASLEKDGTFTNTERRIQRLHQAFPPIGQARADWEILTDLARRMGRDWGYTSPAEVMDEAASLTPLLAGVSYDRLEGYASLQWPVAADGTDQPLLYRDGFALPGGRARLHPLGPRQVSEAPDPEYPLSCGNGRVLEHFHEGSLTMRSRGLAAKVPDAYVEVNRRTAAEHGGLVTGDWVTVESRRGAITLRVLLSEDVGDGQLWVPMHSTSAPINLLTSDAVDDATNTPAYKELAVRVRRASAPEVRGGRRRRAGDPSRRGGPPPDADGRPLPASHHRYGAPTPQRGVEVERKWADPRYVPPAGLGPDRRG
jgi:formate dehydrogenase major subunit